MEFQSEIAGVAQAFAGINAQATAAQNVQRLQVAEQNIAAGTAQIQLEERAQKREIARAFSLHNGQIAAQAAYRGVGGEGSTENIRLAANIQAGEQVALVEANAAAKEVSLIAANQVILDDPFLAGIEGAIQGIQVGTQIAQALIAGGEVTQQQSSQFLGGGTAGSTAFPVFETIISSVFETEGFNINDFFNLEDFS